MACYITSIKDGTMELVMEIHSGGFEAIKEMSEKWNIIIFTVKQT